MPVKITKDGRTILTGKDYTELRHRCFLRDKGRCVLCGIWIWFNSFHLDHKHGRGMGGGKRNDVPEECQSMCGGCHRKKHGQ